MSSNYPDGTGPNDRSAPWNAKDPFFEECPECSGEGEVLYWTSESDDELEKCDLCKGSGKIEVDPNEEDEEWGDDE